MQSDAPEDAEACDGRPSKKPYASPQLTCVGSLADVTRTSANPGPSFDGGGSFPNVSTS